MTEFGAKYGPVAVVTGAARGIGAGFARVLAARGLDLILTDIDAEALRHTATDIGRRTARRVKTTTLDMTDPEAPQALSDFSSSDDIGLVVANHLRPGGSWRVLDTDLTSCTPSWVATCAPTSTWPMSSGADCATAAAVA